MPHQLTTSLLALLWVALLPGLARAATYYVAQGGSGGACTQAQPCGTITAGLAQLAGGDTLLIQGGTYAEALVNNVPSGTADAPTTVRAAPGATVTLVAPPGYDGCMIQQEDRSHLVIDGLHLDGNWQAPYGICTGHGSVHQTFRNFKVYHHPAQGALLGGSHLTLEQLEIYENGNDPSRQGYRHGIYMNASHSTITGSIIRDHALGYGIQLYPSPVNVTFTCNRVINNRSNIYVGGRGHVLRQNVIERSSTGIGIDTSEVLIEENTVSGHTHLGIYWMNAQRGGPVRRNWVFDNATNIAPAPAGALVADNVLAAPGGSAAPGPCAPGIRPSPPRLVLPAPRNLRLRVLP